MHSLAIIVDVTERNQAVEKARKHQEQLEHIARRNTVGELAASLAHEINQPLAAISNYAWCCETELSNEKLDMERVKDLLGKVSDQCCRVSEIVRRLRDFVGKGLLRCSEAEVNHLVREAIALVEPEARSNHVAIRLDMCEEDLFVEADSIQIQQMVLNLATNAIEAMKDTQSNRRKLIVRTFRSKDGHNHVAIEDSGVGFSSDSVGDLFEPCYTTKPNGMGMGLAISRTIVESHGEKISVEANTVGGSIFSFDLPAHVSRS